MIDLETMGTGYRAAIVAIGAVCFDPYSDEVGDTYYTTATLQSAFDLGLRADAGAIEFWLKQPDEARREITEGGGMLGVALYHFRDWLPSNPLVWGNGSNFDCRVLREAYECAGLRCPFHFRDERDMRTIVNFGRDLGLSIEVQREGVHHHALDDAVFQARVIQAWTKTIRAATE
jgi:hypothetical protein